MVDRRHARSDRPDAARRGGGIRVGLALACLALLGALLGGCLGRTTSPTNTTITKWRDLESLPGAHLDFPGATVLGSGGADASTGIFRGTDNAAYQRLLGVNASEDAVFDFYKQQLPALGWQYSPPDIITTTIEGRGLAWRNGKTAYQVTIQKKNYGPLTAQWGDQYATYYVVLLRADQPIR